MGCAGIVVSFALVLLFVNLTGDVGAFIVVIFIIAYSVYNTLEFTLNGIEEIKEALGIKTKEVKEKQGIETEEYTSKDDDEQK